MKFRSKYISGRIFLFIILFLMVFLGMFIKVLSEPVIKIGVYQNDPKVFIDENGIPKGFFIDITNHIAKEKDLSIEYIPGGWSENLKKLEKGDIDIILDASYNDERAEKFKFNNIFIIESWIQVFSYKNTTLEKIKDLNNKKIGVIRNSTQEEYLNKNINDNFDIHFETYSYEDYPSMVNGLISKEIDLFLGDRFFSFSKLNNSEIISKPIVLNPQGIYYLFKKDFNDSIIFEFDDALRSMKNDGDSVYYNSLRKWLNQDLNQEIPRWAKILFFVLLGMSLLAFIIFLLWNHNLKKAIKKKTAELEETKKIRDRIFESSIIPIVIMDCKTYQYIDCNKAAVKASGLNSKKELLTKTPIDLSAPIQYDGTPSEIKAKQYIKTALEQGSVIFEWKNQKPNGKIWDSEVHLISFNANGKTYLQFSILDITSRKRAENKLKYEKIRAEKAIKIKEAFIANMSHELRTPLNGILGFASLLKEEEDDQGKKEYLNYIIYSGENLLKIVNNILKFSKIEKDTLMENIQKTDIHKLIRNISDIFRSRAKKKRLPLITEIEASLPKQILLHKHATFQILNNILDNAVKFTKKGHVIFKTSVVKKGTQKYIKFTIKDSGIGMDKDKLKSLYTPFEQLEYYLNKNYDGAGLGLAISKKLVDKLKGNIEINTELNKGSEFIITLPIEDK